MQLEMQTSPYTATLIQQGDNYTFNQSVLTDHLQEVLDTSFLGRLHCINFTNQYYLYIYHLSNIVSLCDTRTIACILFILSNCISILQNTSVSEPYCRYNQLNTNCKFLILSYLCCIIVNMYIEVRISSYAWVTDNIIRWSHFSFTPLKTL